MVGSRFVPVLELADAHCLVPGVQLLVRDLLDVFPSFLSFFLLDFVVDLLHEFDVLCHEGFASTDYHLVEYFGDPPFVLFFRGFVGCFVVHVR